MATAELIVSPPEEVESEVSELTQWSRSLVVTCAEDFTEAGNRLKQIKGSGKKIVEWFKPMKEQAAAAHKQIVAREKELLAPLDEAERAAKNAMLRYQQAEQAKAEAERRQLQAIADAEARKERERAEAEAAKQREIERAAREKAEQARQEAALASEAERKKLLAQAAAAERKAEAAAVKVEAKAEEAAQAVAPVVHVATEAPKVSGVKTVKTWKYRVIDAALVPDAYKIIDEKKLAGYARAMREGASVPGVHFFYEETLASGSM